jgi:hypothetical protein
MRNINISRNDFLKENKFTITSFEAAHNALFLHFYIGLNNRQAHKKITPENQASVSMAHDVFSSKYFNGELFFFLLFFF